MCQGYDVVKMRLKQVYVIDSQSYLTTATGSCTLCENPLTSSRFEKLPIAVQDWLVNSNCRLGLFSSSLSPVSSLVGSVSSVIQNDWRTAVGLAGSTSLQLEGSRSAVSDFASQPSSPLCLPTGGILPPYESQHFYSPHVPPLHRHLWNTLHLSGGGLKEVTSVRTCLASLNKVSVCEVRNCVLVGLSVGLGLLDASALTGRCRSILSNRDSVAGFSLGFLNHMTEVTGGDGWQGEVSMFTNDSTGFKNWLNRIQLNPDLVSYSILPLPVADFNVSANLKAVVRQPSCEVPNLSGQCCPLQTRRGRLQVTVINAWGLKGDPVGRTEGYVKLWYGKSYRQMHWIKSNDSTHWPVNGSHYHTCRLNRGGFAFSYRLECDNHVWTGSQCNQYKPSLI
uniref:MACPF domain-containing protein n=1 Tax=Esox lucius TaxID=8010 RepID=A0AAY5KPZ1_ESOLU